MCLFVKRLHGDLRYKLASYVGKQGKRSIKNWNAYRHIIFIAIFYRYVGLCQCCSILKRFVLCQVFDGEGGHEHRKQILPSYKAHRLKFLRRIYTSKGLEQLPIGRSHQIVMDFLKDCNVPVRLHCCSLISLHRLAQMSVLSV